MRRNVYLHFINRDARDILGLFRHLSRDTHCKILSRALNAAVILCEDHTVMPPGFFLECELAYDVVSNKTPLIDAGLIILPRRELSLERLRRSPNRCICPIIGPAAANSNGPAHEMVR
jgi:hypothetical protein